MFTRFSSFWHQVWNQKANQPIEIMKDEDAAARPSEGNGSAPKNRKSSGGCAGCLFPLILIVLTIYCSFDKSDFYLMPGEANLWTDAMELTFDNLHQVTPDSLEVIDELDVYKRADNYKNMHNIIYGTNPFIKVRSKENTDRLYLMRVISIVRHTGPDEFELRLIEMDTLIYVDPERYRRR